jgi:hypothetical protein
VKKQKEEKGHIPECAKNKKKKIDHIFELKN